jgi:hypothetical protein
MTLINSDIEMQRQYVKSPIVNILFCKRSTGDTNHVEFMAQRSYIEYVSFWLTQIDSCVTAGRRAGPKMNVSASIAPQS